ncbi:unnamed protein product, partial [Symbiodinium sp. KB8]
MLSAGAGHDPDEWMRQERRPKAALKEDEESLWDRQLRLAPDRLEIAQDRFKTVEAAKNEVECRRAFLYHSPIFQHEHASMLLAGWHCGLLVEHTSVAIVRRRALVQSLERFTTPPPKKRPAAGPSWSFSVVGYVRDRSEAQTCPLVVCDPAWQVSTAKRQLQLALEQQGLAQKLPAMAVKEKNQEKIEAAEKKVEAAKKEVNASPAQARPTRCSTSVGGFGNFVAPNTTADRPLFLRKHLLNVHNKAVEALKAKKIRLASLVGCPGTGKTWCGWLVAYTLQQAGRKTLHLTIRNSTVTAIANFKEKKQYAKVSWNENMLEQVLRESKCQVCIVDVSMDKAEQALDIFIGVRQLIERGEEFAGVKFMGLLSGHGQKTITGKQSNVLNVTQKLVLWSWTDPEVAGLREKMNHHGLKLPPKHAYAVCGGSVRHLFQPHEDEKQIRDAVRGLTQANMAKLLALDLGVDDVDKKHRTGLLSFFPRQGSNEDRESFEEGVSEAQPMPRSDFVIKCIKENEHAEFEQVARMYRKLLPMNAGAAGTAFELLVHLFWRDAAVQGDTVTLALVSSVGKDRCKKDPSPQTIKVNCENFMPKPDSIEDYDAKGVVCAGLVGYFTPVNPRYPVLDGILRYKSAGEIEVLAIHISIAATHEHGKLAKPPKLLTSRPGSDKLRLALWDFRKENKSCGWKPNKSEHWKLLHVSCKAFD